MGLLLGVGIVVVVVVVAFLLLALFVCKLLGWDFGRL